MNLTSHNKRIIQDFFADKPVKRAYLFGSYARNTAIKGESDIDILIELDYSKKIGLEFIQMIFDLENLLNLKVDLVTTDGLSKYVKPFIDKDKILLYERAA